MIQNAIQAPQTQETLWFNLFQSNNELYMAIRCGASQENIDKRIEKITQVVTDIETFNQKAEKDDVRLGLGSMGRKILQIAALSITGIGALAGVGAGIGTAIDARNATYVQTSNVWAGNVAAQCVVVVGCIVTFVYFLADGWPKDPTIPIGPNQDKSQTLGEFWSHYKQLKLYEPKENTLWDNSFQIDKKAINQQFDKCATSLKEIKIDSNLDQEIKDRLASLVIQALPEEHELKKMLVQQKELDEKINLHLKNEKIELTYKERKKALSTKKIEKQELPEIPVKKRTFLTSTDVPSNDHVIINIENDSRSMSEKTFCLDAGMSDKDQQELPNKSNLADEQDLIDRCNNNFNYLSHQFGFEISHLYIDGMIYSNLSMENDYAAKKDI